MPNEPRTTDYAEQWRRDLSQFPAAVVLAAAKRHLMSLRLLREGAADKAKAISDMTAFLKENQHG